MSGVGMKKVASSAMNFLIQGTKIGVVTFLTLNYVGGFVVCYGPSMEPTLHTRDVLLTEHISPRLKRIDVGDVVVARSPDDNRCVCKRVVARPGDTVQYKNESITIPEECVWLEGDNKGNSNDSRYYGPVPYSMVRRRCFCKVWPHLDLSLSTGGSSASNALFLLSSQDKKPEYSHVDNSDVRKQGQCCWEALVKLSKESKGQTSDSLEKSGNNSHCDKANDERGELFPVMKTSDSASLGGTQDVRM